MERMLQLVGVVSLFCVAGCESNRAVVRVKNSTADGVVVGFGDAGESLSVPPQEIGKTELKGLFPEEFSVIRNGHTSTYLRPLPSRIYTRPYLVITEDAKIYSGYDSEEAAVHGGVFPIEPVGEAAKH